MKSLFEKIVRRYIASLLFIILLNSCRYSQKDVKEFVYKDFGGFNRIEKAATEIDISEAKSLSYRDYIDDFVDSVYFLQLSSEELIGEITSLCIFEDRIFILDQFLAKKVFIFNMQGGLIRAIDNQGGGPNEYLRLGRINVNEDSKELIIADEGYPKFLHYSLDGELIRKTQTVPGFFYYPGIDDSFYNCVGYKQMKSETGEEYALLLCKDTFVLNAGFPFYPTQQDAVTSNPFNKNALGELLYIPFLCDTVYHLFDNQCYQAKYVINQTKSLWNKKNESLSNIDHADLIFDNNYTSLGSEFFENNDYCCFFVNLSCKGKILLRPYYYNKKERETFYFDFEKIFDKTRPFKNGLYVIANPQCVYKDYFVSSFNPIPVLNDSVLFNKHYLEIMNAADDNTNPTLIFYKFNGKYK